MIWFASPREWQEYPAWARDRRDEIVARVKSEFAPPDYEYHGDDPGTAASSAATASVPPPAVASTRAHAGSTSPAQWRALAVAIVLLLAIAAGAAGLVERGLARGETWLPLPHASQRRVVARADEPATFWLSIGVYSAIGAGTLGLAAWGIREGVRLRRG